MNVPAAWLAAAALMMTTFSASAAEVGAALPALVLKDPSGATHTLSTSVRRIYANGDRKGDSLMKAAMTGVTQAELDAQGAVVIADISEAPGFVKMLIRSSLKDRGYITWLDVTGATRKFLPYRKDQITLLELDQRRITAIRFLADEDSLKRELRPAPQTPAAQAPPKP